MSPNLYNKLQIEYELQCPQDSLLDWNRYDPLYQKILSFDLLWTKTTTTASHNKDCLYGIYGMEIGTVDVTQGLHLLLTHLMQIYSAFRVIILCCITNEPQKDRKQMIDLSTTIQLNPDFRHNFSIKFFFHSNDYERWLKSLQDMNIKCQILRDWFSSKPPAPHFHLSFKDDEDKQTKLQWKASANKTNK